MINILDLSGLEGLISVASPEAAVDPSIRNPSSHGLFSEIGLGRKAYGLGLARHYTTLFYTWTHVDTFLL